MAKLAVHSIDGKEKEKINLPDEIFGERVNTEVLHQAVVMYRACERQGTASTKERADRRGGGRKPYRQKGTGQARSGSRRSPIYKGGGITFGPHPRDFSYSIPKKMKKAALRASVNDKFQSENMFCVDEIKGKIEKTKEFAAILTKLKLSGKILAVLDGADPTIARASHNIKGFNIVRSEDVNAYDVIRNKKVLFTKSAVDNLLKRLV